MKIDRFKARRWIVAILAMAVFLLFTARLINVQIVQADTIRKELETGTTRSREVKAVRGEIVDRNGVSLVVNRLGYDVVIDDVSFPRQERSEVLLRLIRIFEENDTGWIDNLPITAQEPFAFLEGQDTDIARLKDKLEVHQYTSVEDTLYHLTERYKLQEFSALDARKIAGVLYEMEQRGFSIDVLYTFARDIDIDLVLQIKERSYLLPGIDVRESPIRSYDMGSIAPHIIGRTGPIYAGQLDELKEKGYAMDDYVGKSGAELAFEDLLRGKNGRSTIRLDKNWNAVETSEEVSTEPGNTVYLTLDVELQQRLQEALQAQIRNLQQTAAPGKGKEANYGAAVVVHCKTGEVLACVTYPSYDLNTFVQDYDSLREDPGLPLYNRAIQGLYAPGSIFKPVVGVAGLSTGWLTEHPTTYCGRYYTRFPNHRFTCMFHHGEIDLIRALKVSCNIFFYDTGYNLGIEQVDLTSKQFGLGEPTGIELLEESVGQRSNPETYERITGEKWTEGNVVQSSIGQLVSEFTPLQLAGYTATLANRGERMKLTIVKEVRDYSRNEVLQPLEPEVAARVDGSRENFESVIQGMVAASHESGGTAVQHFGNYPIKVASKTGTPEATMLNSTFIAFAPADDPEIAVAVVIENGYHGYTSAPVAKAVFDHYFQIHNPNPLTLDTAEESPPQTATQTQAEPPSAADASGSEPANDNESTADAMA